MHNLSDEALCDRWVENPYFQYFCGEVMFRHDLLRIPIYAGRILRLEAGHRSDLKPATIPK
jgi:hypothetical protein